MKKAILILICLLLIGCEEDSSPTHYQGASIVMIGDLMESTYTVWYNDYIRYSARIKNEGDRAAYDIQFWVMCYDSSDLFMLAANWVYNDTLYPGLSVMATVDTDVLVSVGIDSVATDIEWIQL